VEQVPITLDLRRIVLPWSQLVVNGLRMTCDVPVAVAAWMAMCALQHTHAGSPAATIGSHPSSTDDVHHGRSSRTRAPWVILVACVCFYSAIMRRSVVSQIACGLLLAWVLHTKAPSTDGAATVAVRDETPPMFTIGEDVSDEEEEEEEEETHAMSSDTSVVEFHSTPVADIALLHLKSVVCQ
jgi:hypothetical protein